MGVNIATEIYQKKMSDLLLGLNGVICYQDDVVVFGRNREEYAENLTKIIDRLKKSGLKLNKEKCSFGQS